MPLRILTFNIRNSEDDRGTVHDWENRKEKILKIIGRYRPHIFGLQEVLPEQMEYLISELREYTYIGVGRDDGKNAGEFNPIFYLNDGRLKIESGGTFWLSETPEICSNTWAPRRPNRVCTWANFRLPRGMIFQRFGVHSDEREEEKCEGGSSGNTLGLAFYNTHLDNGSSKVRMNSIDCILNMMEKQSAGYPIILTGDFNFDRKSKEYEYLSSKLSDALTEVNPEDEIEKKVTYHGFSGKTEGRKAHRDVIDYIWHNEGVRVLHAEIINYNPGDGEIFPSDHWPVFAEISIKCG